MHQPKFIPLVVGAAVLLAGCGPAAAPKPGPSSTPKTASPGTASKNGPATKGASKNMAGPRGWLSRTSVVKPISLATLPPIAYLKRLNPWLRRAHQVSGFITGMGYHWATPYPGLVLMTNSTGLVTAVEAEFPQRLGTFPWFDPVTTVPNGSVAFNSEHLYFINPASIVPNMTATASDLTSWTTFSAVNPRLDHYVQKGTFHGLTVYGPPNGPGIDVLTKAGGVAGFMVAEPASWGHFPGYYPARRRPMASALYGKAYQSIVLLTPIASTNGAKTNAGATRAKSGGTGKAGVRPRTVMRTRKPPARMGPAKRGPVARH
jgi:hypothetical protein